MRAALLLALACACSRPFGFEHARHEESRSRWPSAAAAYLRFVEADPSDPRAPEALTRAASIHARVFGRCDRAVPLYERAARSGAEPWAERARLGLMACPDYLPLVSGASWTYVDSQSGGRNMRLVFSVEASSDGARATASGDYFAGEKKVQPYRRSYERRDWTLWERAGEESLPILKYPARAGRSWTHKNASFDVEAEDVAVRVRAGQFAGCLKVRRRPADLPSWSYDYYCPGVGRVKTTIGVPGAENPNTELAAYDIPK